MNKEGICLNKRNKSNGLKIIILSPKQKDFYFFNQNFTIAFSQIHTFQLKIQCFIK